MSTVPPTEPGTSFSVLIVFPWCLDEVGHGNTQRVLAYARYLAQNGVAVDLVYQGRGDIPSREAELTGFRRVIRVIARPGSQDERLAQEWRRFYTGLPEPHINLGASGVLTMAVRGLLEAQAYSAVISSYAWTAPIFDRLQRRALRICDLHDVLFVHGERSLQATGQTTPFSMAEETERFLWRQWDALLAISPEEAAVVQSSLRPTQRLLTMGHAVPIGPSTTSTPDRVVYIASDNPTNQVAVRWLLEEVWPHVVDARPASQLRIVGLIAAGLRGTPLAETPNVELVGFVEHPDAELQAAALAVAPYRYGSGLKIKVIEAAAAGRAIVTTSTGLEGTGMSPGEELLVEDDPRAFARAIVRLLDDPALRQRVSESARQFINRRFSPDACYGPLLELLQAHSDAMIQPGVIPPAVGLRLRTALQMLDPGRIVVWGNGSHTRSLLSVIDGLAVPVACIVDKSAGEEHRSPEGVRVVSPRQFEARAGDLIVLSSQLFEADMWKDLRQVRTAGIDVLPLYRTDLLPDDLRDRLMPAPAARPAPSRSGGTRRLIIAEPSAGRSHGPFFRLARAIRDASNGSAMEVIVAGSRVASLRGLEPQDHELLDPAFEFTCWDVLPELNGQVWPAISRYARYMAKDLERMSARLDVGQDDVVLFHTTTILDVLAAGEWLASRAPRQRPAVRLLFHFVPEQEAGWLKIAPVEVRHAYALAFAQLRERAEDLRVLTQTPALAPALERVLQQAVAPMGFPVPARLRAASSPRPSSPVRLLYAGEARADKGFGMLPAVVDALKRERDAGTLTVVCQSMLNEFADEKILRAVRTLKAQPGVEVIDRFLPSCEYDRLIAGCDLVLLPYDARWYRSRLSAVFVDATCAGVLPIVPDQTWMSQELTEGYGIGTTFATLSGRGIASAVRQALDQIVPMKQAARAAAGRVWDKHDPHRVLATILGTEDVPSSAATPASRERAAHPAEAC